MKKQLLLIGLAYLTCNSLNAQFYDVSEPQKLNGDVNTLADESMPIFSKDSSILYFSRILDPKNKGGEFDQDIWMSSKEANGTYNGSQKVTALNNKMKNGVVGINKDGSHLYLLNSYEGKKDQKKGIAMVEIKGNSFGKPKQIDIPDLDIDGDFYGFTISQNEDVIVISYAGPNSLGMEDLYISTKNAETWSTPQHMGNVINTAGYEMSPFLSVNADTIYFSTDGISGGFGDADVYYSVRQDKSNWTSWSTPKNLGNKINSIGFDAYFTMSGNQVFWVSNRGDGKDDIYFANKINPPALDGEIVGTDITVYKGLDGKADLTVKGGVAPFTFKWSNDATTEDLEGVEKGEYSVIITDAIGQTKTLTVILNEPELKTGSDIAELLTPPVIIYFDLGSWTIKPESAAELDRIVAFMNEHPNVVVELGSHTDCRSSADFNMRLSQNRAASTAQYVKARIKNPNRIYGKGFGETKLKTNCPCEGTVLPSCPEDQHQLNRRTEFIVIHNQADKIPKVDKITPKIVDYKKNPFMFRLKNQTESTGSTFVPAPMRELTPEEKKNIESGFYIVKKGETLFRVYKYTGVSIEDLKRLNNLTGNEVKPGQKMILK